MRVYLLAESADRDRDLIAYAQQEWSKVRYWMASLKCLGAMFSVASRSLCYAPLSRCGRGQAPKDPGDKQNVVATGTGNFERALASLLAPNVAQSTL